MILTFQETGTYTFGDIRILCQSMDNYPEQVSALKENVLKDEKITDNGIEGTITVDQNKILCLSVPVFQWVERLGGWTENRDISCESYVYGTGAGKRNPMRLY